MTNPGSSAYKPISDYAVIGDMRTAVLVGRDGSIDWCCFPRLDKGSVFGALLDSRTGGRFQIRPVHGREGEQAYIGTTNVLVTEFNPKGGILRLTDFMPVSGNIHRCRGSQAANEIHRIVESGESGAEVAVEWSPRFGYGMSRTRIERTDGGWVASANGNLMSLS